MRILLPSYNGCCCLHAKTGLWVSVNPWGQNNTQFGLARWNAHRLWHLCLWMWTSPLQYWGQFKVYVLTPWLWIVSIHVIPFTLNMCYIWGWPWSYTLLLTFNTVDTVVYVKFACELVFVNLPVFVYMVMLLPLSMWKLPVEKKNIYLMTACSKIGVGGADALAPAGARASETTMLNTAGVHHRNCIKLMDLLLWLSSRGNFCLGEGNINSVFKLPIGQQHF